MRYYPSEKKLRPLKMETADQTDNVLKKAPHTAKVISSDNWEHAYTRNQAAFPLPYVSERKFWPSVERVNDSHGDRSLICSCPPIEAYEHQEA